MKIFKISPLEGMPLLPICLVSVIIFSLLGIILHGILSIIMWVLVIPFAIFLIGMLSLRLSHKWSRVHYPVMVRYARTAGMAAGLYPNEDAKKRVDIGLILLLKSLYPNVNEGDIAKMYEEMLSKGNVFHDKEMLVRVLDKNIKSKAHKENEEMSEKLLNQYKAEDENSMKVRYIVSELIRIKYGEEEQQEYIFAVMSGRAK